MSTSIPNRSKFALRTFSGKPTQHYRVDREEITTVSAAKVPSHHIIFIDRSGSMYGSIPDVKTTVKKVLTLQEFNDPSLLVTLGSFSSQGDVKIHFKRVPVSQIMATGSIEQKAIDAIQATAMTAIGQSLTLAETLINDSEVTAVTIHTDGFGNDPSPTLDTRVITTAIAALKKHPRVFVNTIAYGGWCDFNTMNLIANSLSGVCIQARDMKAVYKSLYDTTLLLSGSLSPSVEASKGTANYVVFVSRKARKVIGAAESLQIQGLAADDDKSVYRYYAITEEEYNGLDIPVSGQGEFSAEPILAFARTQLAQGNLNVAKFATVASSNGDLLTAHAKALVSSEVAAFSGALETALFNPSQYVPQATYGLPSAGPSVLRVLSLLGSYHGAVEVNIKEFTAKYKRRGVKRVNGVRKDDGTLELPAFETRYREASDGYVAVSGFDINRNTASINMLVNQSIDLFPRGGNTRIASVKGVSLEDMKAFNNYTIVGDGSLTVDTLPVRISDKRLFGDLKALGLVSGEYTPQAVVTIDLSRLPLVDYDQEFDSVSPTTVKNLVRLSVLSKAIDSMVKGESASLTDEQIAELKTHYITPSLNFSPPTTTEYADLQQALSTGQIDTRLSYKINIGLPDLGVDKLASGNAALQRRFTATQDGKPVDKPTMQLFTQPSVGFALKKLTAATKLDAVDDVTFPIYMGLTGLGSVDEVSQVMKLAGVVKPETVLTEIRSGDKDRVVAAVTDLQKKVDAAIEGIYDTLRPLAFYVGATGLVPDTLGAQALNVDEYTAKFPSAKLSKAEKEEGTFFLLPSGVVITVFVKGEYFSTGLAA